MKGEAGNQRLEITPMKILQVVHSFIPDNYAGTEVYTYQLSRELAKRHTVTVFFRAKRPAEKEYSLSRDRLDGIQTIAVNRTFNNCHSFRDMYSDARIDRIFGELLDQQKPDIIHIHHLLFLSSGIAREAKKRGIPVIFTIHDYWLFCHKGQLIRDDFSICNKYNASGCRQCLRYQLNIKGSAMRFYNLLRKALPPQPLRRLRDVYVGLSRLSRQNNRFEAEGLNERMAAAEGIIQNIDLFISPSRFARDKFIEFGVGKEKIMHLTSGISTGDCKVINKRRSGIVRFGYIGILLPMKGVDFLIKTFQEFSDDNAELLVFGRPLAYAGYEGYAHYLKKLARKDARVKLMGGFEHKDLSGIFSQFDVLILPSLWPENSPLAILEAFAHQTPVVASDIGGIPELIIDGSNGLLFKAGDVSDLLSKFKLVAENRHILDNLFNNLPLSKTISENAGEIEELYYRLIAKGTLSHVQTEN